MSIDQLVNLPSRSQAPATFIANANAVWPQLNTFATQANVLASTMTGIAAGTALAIPYTFSTTTTDSDPGAGVIRFNSTTQNIATTLRTDLSGSDGNVWTSVLDTFDDSTSTVKGQIMLVKVSDGTKWLAFNVTAVASPSGYRNITVTNIASSAASPFADGDSVVLKFTRAGDKGDTGTSSTLLLSTRSSNTILGSGDSGKLINVSSGTFTQTLDPCATLGNGWWCFYKNSGTGVVTIDPSGAETIGGAATLVVTQGMSVVLQGNGSSIDATLMDGAGDHEVVVHTGNGFGSTNTVIRRFTTTMTNIGTAITYADSATNGASFTINEAGLYSIAYTDTGNTGSYYVGASLNSAQLTTAVQSISVANRLMIGSGGSTSSIVPEASRVVRLSAGDVVRPHCGNVSSVTGVDDKTFFAIRKVGI